MLGAYSPDLMCALTFAPMATGIAFLYFCGE